MEEHLGREKYERNTENNSKNYRNEYSKNIGSSFCDIDADIPRDRDA